MTRKKLLTIAATAVVAYCAGEYPLGLHSPFDSFSRAAGTESKTLESGGRTRTYLIHRPKGYDGKTPLPLVLHGATQSAAGIERITDQEWPPHVARNAPEPE